MAARGAVRQRNFAAPILKTINEMREIKEIIIHCTATPRGRDVTAADVDRWHRAAGMDGIGYHYLVRLDGTVERGRPLWRAGAHCRGHNAASVGVAYAGGVEADGVTPADTRTPAQRAALAALVERLRGRFPGAGVWGHRDFARKACPCFDARREFSANLSGGGEH